MNVLNPNDLSFSSLSEINSDSFSHLLNSTDVPFLLDVREPSEWDITHIPGSVLLPLELLVTRYTELPTDRLIVVLCHHGVRSLQAALFLKECGFKQVFSLKGGLHRWSQFDNRITAY